MKFLLTKYCPIILEYQLKRNGYSCYRLNQNDRPFDIVSVYKPDFLFIHPYDLDRPISKLSNQVRSHTLNNLIECFNLKINETPKNITCCYCMRKDFYNSRAPDFYNFIAGLDVVASKRRVRCLNCSYPRYYCLGERHLNNLNDLVQFFSEYSSFYFNDFDIDLLSLCVQFNKEYILSNDLERSIKAVGISLKLSSIDSIIH